MRLRKTVAWAAICCGTVVLGSLPFRVSVSPLSEIIAGSAIVILAIVILRMRV